MRPIPLRKKEKVKQDHDAGRSYAEIARKHKVSKGTIHNILREDDDPATKAERTAYNLLAPVQNFAGASQNNTLDDPPVQALASLLRSQPERIKTFKIAFEMVGQAIEVAERPAT